ncbi:acyl-CoA N-acyltransferase [Poronia punctata]|nr:acyl-CoA N-acyltransferase [Poronia punctata]
MAPQKRKHSHDGSQDRSTRVPPPVPTRRSTRQHPDSGAETEHQLRSGRIRTNSLELLSIDDPSEAKHPMSRARDSDVTKAAADPTTAMKQARTTRHRAAGGSETVVVAALSPAAKKNVQRQPPGEDGGQRATIFLPKQTRHHNAHPQNRSRNSALHVGTTSSGPNPRKRSRSPSGSISKPRERLPSPSTSPALVPRPSRQSARPKPTTTAAHSTGGPSLTPKRKSHVTSKTPRPPGTPHSDRNIDQVVFGNICFKAWYPSYYGKEVLGDVSATVGGGHAKIGGGKRDKLLLDRLYICPCCFKYSRELEPWRGHMEQCERKARVPGMKIYTHPRRSIMASATDKDVSSDLNLPTGASRGKGKGKSSEKAEGDTANHGEWSVWEVDGEKEGLFCQNLSLFAKLFLDNKSVFFDVTGFNYFLLVYTPHLPETPQASPLPATSAVATKSDDAQSTTADTLQPPPRPQIVGFFSKEKMSWDNNNLACILIFPPWQRKGLGALLMGISYEISRREGLLGGPEKPISELGYKGYKRFWAGEIVRWLLELQIPSSTVEPSHMLRHSERDQDQDRKQDNDELLEENSIIVDVEQCSRETWIVPEDCIAVLRDMGVIEEAGLGPPRSNKQTTSDGDDAISDPSGQGKEGEEKPALVPRVRIDKAAVRAWARENKLDLTRACDPDGFLIPGYAVRKAKAESEGEEKR